jgi:hypothetical protein
MSILLFFAFMIATALFLSMAYLAIGGATDPHRSNFFNAVCFGLAGLCVLASGVSCIMMFFVGIRILALFSPTFSNGVS